MSFLLKGLVLFGVFFVTGDGQFVVSSPFYAGESAFQEVPRVKTTRKIDPITGTEITSLFTDDEEDGRRTKKVISDKRNKNWMELDTDEVSEYDYPNNEKTPGQNEFKLRYFNAMTPLQQPFQNRGMESIHPIKAIIAMRELASQLANLLFFLERAPMPLSMFMLSGALNLRSGAFNQEPNLPSDKAISPDNDGTGNNQTSNELQIVENAMIAEQAPIIIPFRGPPPVGPNPSLSQYFSNLSGSNSDNIKPSNPKPTSEETNRSEKSDTQLSNDFNPDMYLPEFRNDIPAPVNPRFGRRRIDNNLRQVPDVPYTGFYPDYNAGNPYLGAMHPPGYYDFDSMKSSPYGKPKDHQKKAWKKEQHKLLKEKMKEDKFEEEESKKSRSKKDSKKRRNGMNRGEMDDYMFWPPPPSYAV